MITPQSIREKTFEKAVFGGYDMGEVDDFLENAANDLAALQKENSVLKGKMKVLVEKIEEYRTSEDAMRMALLSAQKMAKQISDEASQNASQTLAEARAEAERILQKVRGEAALEETRLQEARQSTAQYLENMRLLSQKHLRFLDSLGQLQPGIAEVPAPATAPVESRVIPLRSTSVGQEPSEEDLREIGDRVAHLAEDVEPELDLRDSFDDEPAGPDPDEPTRLFVK